MMELATQRLTLRPTTAKDADAMRRMAEDFEVVRHTGSWPWPADPAFTSERCAQGFDKDGGWLAACLDGQLVGTIGVQSDGDFGYMLARSHWGQGLATEMGHAVIDHAAGLGRWNTLKACVFDDNPASGRVLEKLGFSETGTCHGHCAARKGEFPIRTYTRALP